MKWMSQTVIDTRGSVDLDEELVARTGWTRGMRLGSWTR